MKTVLRFAALIVIIAASAFAQLPLPGGSSGGGSGFVGVGALSAIPATCTVGQLYFATDASAGQNIYECAATNTWTQQLNSGSGGASIALDNLASVSINAALLFQAAKDAGSTTKPIRNIFIYGAGTYGSTYLELTGTPTGNRVITIPDATDTLVNLGSTQTLSAKTFVAPVLGAATATSLATGSLVTSAQATFQRTLATGTINALFGPAIASYAAGIQSEFTNSANSMGTIDDEADHPITLRVIKQASTPGSSSSAISGRGYATGGSLNYLSGVEGETTLAGAGSPTLLAGLAGHVIVSAGSPVQIAGIVSFGPTVTNVTVPLAFGLQVAPPVVSAGGAVTAFYPLFVQGRGATDQSAFLDGSVVVAVTGRTTTGQTDSPYFIWSGSAHDGATENSPEWRSYADTTSNAGASSWTLDQRIESGSYTSRLVLTDGGNLTTSNLKRGSGSPESAVVGVVGDLYERTDGGAGTSAYIKESGSGNTGWVAIAPGSGSGITTLDTLSGATQTFAFDETGTTPGVTPSGTTHTFHHPLASAAGVTNGGITKAFYDTIVTTSTLSGLLSGVYPTLAGPNTFIAGGKNSWQASATTAGARIVCGTNPSSPVAGDLNCDASGIFFEYDGTIQRGMVSNTAGQDLRALSTGFAKITTTTGAFTTVVPGTGIETFLTTNSTTVGQVLRVSASNTYTWGAVDLADTDAVTGTLADARLPASMDSKTFTTYLIAPQGTGPTVDAAGKIAVDTTTDQLDFYGGAKRAIPSIYYMSFVIPAPATTDDINLVKVPYGMTILGIDAIVQGTTSVTGQLQECASDGTSCVDLDSDIVADADGAADDGTISDPTIASGAWLRWKTTSVSGTPTFLTVTVRYRVVPD